jgi:phospholipid transport system transporter-binding protein
MAAAAAVAVELKESSPGRFAAHGPLTFATARSARDSGLAAFGTGNGTGNPGGNPGAIEVDCSGITASDSAGMAVLLDWLAIAKRSGRSLHFGGLPRQVQDIAKICDVLELLEKGV